MPVDSLESFECGVITQIGKTVRTRHGPAAVIGDESWTMPLFREEWEGPASRLVSESQKTCRQHKAPWATFKKLKLAAAAVGWIWAVLLLDSFLVGSLKTTSWIESG